jgi:jouberin
MINENNVNLCWAFLKIFSPTFMNIDEKLKLQFYEYQRPKKILKFRGKPLGEKKELSVYEQWQHKNRRKFPSYLNVTVKSLEVRKKQDDPEKKESQVETVAPENLAIFSNWRKLPGQACKIPNKLLHKSIFHEKGSMIVKFSHDGNFLAFTEIQKHNFILRVMKVNF